ncbi:MAG: hypothetical protein P4N60_11110 [Verrucomicrobiae bacterium]|nr:hypothetical protein [Verrucomicrobiae bacterium]
MTTPLFIIEYAGAPMRFSQGTVEVVSVLKADRYCTEPDAWLEARAQRLDLQRCTVRNIADELNQQPIEMFEPAEHHTPNPHKCLLELADEIYKRRLA